MSIVPMPCPLNTGTSALRSPVVRHDIDLAAQSRRLTCATSRK